MLSLLQVRPTNLNLNDGDGTGGPGFKRYLGMLSIDIGISIYPDVKSCKNLLISTNQK
ncbi:MAG: hypothetical protein R3A12_13435 [Ignavibacteria bacterium]